MTSKDLSMSNYFQDKLWIINNYEENYYKNSLILLNKYKNKWPVLPTVLRYYSSNFTLELFQSKLVNIKLISDGTFGEMYHCNLLGSDEHFSIKFIPDSTFKIFRNDVKKILKQSVDVLHVIKAKQSPYVVKYYSSIQSSYMPSSILFFEYYLGSLSVILQQTSLFKSTPVIFRLLNENKQNSALVFFQKLLEIFDFDFFEVFMIYILELYCGLDYLSNCNIVHGSIKADSIMVGLDRHLKYSDFGLAYSMTVPETPGHIQYISQEFSNHLTSTFNNDLPISYAAENDLEIMMSFDKTIKIENLIINTRNILPYNINFDDNSLNFLSDLWSLTSLCVGMVTGVNSIFDMVAIPNDILSKWNIRRTDFIKAKITMCFSRLIYEKYIYNGLISYATGKYNFRELATFFADVFKPRAYRAENYVKPATVVNSFNRTQNTSKLDIDKFMEINIFRRLKLTKYNVYLKHIPNIIDLFFTNKSNQILYHTFDELISDKYVEEKSDRPSIIKPLFEKFSIIRQSMLLLKD